MSKLVLLSVAVALVGLPLLAARDPHPARGLKKALVGVVSFNLLFAFVLRVVLPRLSS